MEDFKIKTHIIMESKVSKLKPIHLKALFKSSQRLKLEIKKNLYLRK